MQWNCRSVRKMKNLPERKIISIGGHANISHFYSIFGAPTIEKFSSVIDVIYRSLNMTSLIR